MLEKLHGTEFRVFRCLIHESQFESFDEICVELTHAPALEPEEVAEALKSLLEKGYAEEFAPDRWKYTQNGYGVRRSLLGEPIPGG
jgi:hypothetical protein